MMTVRVIAVNLMAYLSCLIFCDTFVIFHVVQERFVIILHLSITDHNNDGFVSENEFASLPPGDVDAGWGDIDKAWQEERRKEFRSVIDLDRDGKVSKDELKVK